MRRHGLDGERKDIGNDDGLHYGITMSRTEKPTCERVRRALDAIIVSETFSRSGRLRSFLSYVVENELSGKAAQLKGYSVGIDVFGRKPGFDAGNDPLVRVQAGKLRKLLEQYYETEGALERLRIRVPLGSYVPEYIVIDDMPEAAACEAPEAVRVLPAAPGPRRPWIPAPVSSPLALFSLLPLFFLAPSIYPETTNAAIDNAQYMLVQGRFAGQMQALPQLHIEQCWPAGGDCSAFARAIANSAGFHRTVHLVESRRTEMPGLLSYMIRIENRPDGHGVYARLIHEQSGATIFARHFSREQLRSEAGIAYEAVAFAARTLSASGPLYRHALRTGSASGIMECLAREAQAQPHGLSRSGPANACPGELPAALAEAAPSDAETPLLR